MSMHEIRINPAVVRTLLPLVLLSSSLLLGGQARAADGLKPDSVFAELGGNRGAETATLGLGWDLDWQSQTRWGPLSSRLELSAGRWRSDGEGEHKHMTSQFGVTPMFRLRPESWGGHWSVDAGIGLNVLTPHYRRGDKRFATEFNFGDQLGLAYQWGEQDRHELGLRLIHYSNGGIKKPNPGDNFMQLRYAYRL